MVLLCSSDAAVTAACAHHAAAAAGGGGASGGGDDGDPLLFGARRSVLGPLLLGFVDSLMIQLAHGPSELLQDELGDAVMPAFAAGGGDKNSSRRKAGLNFLAVRGALSAACSLTFHCLFSAFSARCRSNTCRPCHTRPPWPASSTAWPPPRRPGHAPGRPSQR